jgi:anti-sigma regulatory factor (Ser/Thr protein kinase)
MTLLLDFRLLDDLGLAASRGRHADLADHRFQANELGPLVELALMRRIGSAGLPEFAAIEPSSTTAAVAALFEQRPTERISADQIGAHFVSLHSDQASEDRWTAFQYWAQRAAERAGLQKRISQQLIGALGELEDNVHLHSQAIDTGYVAYRAGDGEFEFVVADGGVGILRSLQSCGDYSSLKDSGDALQIALQDGESRFGRAAQRGCGFRPLFVGLANLKGMLRFRSGDHVLVIDGRSPTLTMASVHERAYLQGFVASITCRNPA